MILRDDHGGGVGLQDRCVDQMSHACFLGGVDHVLMLACAVVKVAGGNQNQTVDALQRGGQGFGLMVISFPRLDTQIGDFGRVAHQGNDITCVHAGFHVFDGKATQLAAGPCDGDFHGCCPFGVSLTTVHLLPN